MARIFTWTGRGGDGGNALVAKQFDGQYTYLATPVFANIALMGGYCLSLPSGACGVKIAFSAKGEIYIGMRIMPQSQDTGSRLFTFNSGTTILAQIARYNYGTGVPFPGVYCYRGAGTTFVGGGNIFIDDRTDMAWYIEVYYKPDATNGRLVTKINGVVDCDYTGNTVPASQTTLDNIWIGMGYANATVGWYVNDIVVDDANWPGVVNFAVLPPTGAGNSAQWSPSAGSDNFACVDESPPTLADYNKTNTADQTDSFAATNLPAAADVVKSVNVKVFALKEQAPTPTTVKALVRTGSTPTNYVGDAVAPDIYFTEIEKIWEQNPYTSSGWLVSEVNSMEIGYKSAA